MQTIKGLVTGVTPLTKRIVELRLKPAGDQVLPGFSPGSHIRVVLPDGDSRAYSLIRFDPLPDAATDYCIAVQLEPDGTGGSRFMHGLAVGDAVRFEPPKNDFPLLTDQPALLLAGGIGVTPMISMATALTEAGQRFDFHYSGRAQDVMAYRDTLQDRFGDALHLHYDDTPASTLNLTSVIADIQDNQHLYICGPRGMIDAAKATAEAAGIDTARIHIELFDTPTAAEDTAFEVELTSTGEVFTVPPGQSIIEVLEAGGVDVMYDCQRGDCGICQVDVISGTPDHRDVVLSEAERAAGKVMQICVSRAKSPRLVLDI
ncbi:MAG: ferredoxin-NADP reductase [Paracoccaceae bacterium]